MSDDKSQQPVPNYTILEGAVALHELFISYIEAGFKRTEALQIVIAMIPKPSEGTGDGR